MPAGLLWAQCAPSSCWSFLGPPAHLHPPALHACPLPALAAAPPPSCALPTCLSAWCIQAVQPRNSNTHNPFVRALTPSTCCRVARIAGPPVGWGRNVDTIKRMRLSSSAWISTENTCAQPSSKRMMRHAVCAQVCCSHALGATLGACAQQNRSACSAA